MPIVPIASLKERSYMYMTVYSIIVAFNITGQICCATTYPSQPLPHRHSTAPAALHSRTCGVAFECQTLVLVGDEYLGAVLVEGDVLDPVNASHQLARRPVGAVT